MMYTRFRVSTLAAAAALLIAACGQTTSRNANE